jgi:hypothetical protein
MIKLFAGAKGRCKSSSINQCYEVQKKKKCSSERVLCSTLKEAQPYEDRN